MLINKLKRRFKPGARQPFLRWRILGLLTFGALFCTLMLSSYFLYYYVYRTLTDANTIVFMDTTGDVETVNQLVYTKAKNAIAQKNAAATSTLPAPLRNIFSYDTVSFVPTTTPENVPPASTSP